MFEAENDIKKHFRYVSFNSERNPDVNSEGGHSMKLKLRLLWRKAMTDFNGVVAEYVYKTDDIILPEDAQAFQFPDTEKYGWMPELVGGEWIKEDE